mmetsp:Transcript_7357/g.13948  ORF Transcript_7357/g.13948 Transcript_7357/m.13948 type:complete len:253 (-) Transcript_7357:1613-2371(-)
MLPGTSGWDSCTQVASMTTVLSTSDVQGSLTLSILYKTPPLPSKMLERASRHTSRQFVMTAMKPMMFKMKYQVPMLPAPRGSGRRVSLHNLCASKNISIMLETRASSGVRGNATTNREQYPNCMTISSKSQKVVSNGSSTNSSSGSVTLGSSSSDRTTLSPSSPSSRVCRSAALTSLAALAAAAAALALALALTLRQVKTLGLSTSMTLLTTICSPKMIPSWIFSCCRQLRSSPGMLVHLTAGASYCLTNAM